MSSRPWQSILVAVADPARRGQPAIRKAARLAAASRARVTLFHAFAAPQYGASIRFYRVNTGASCLRGLKLANSLLHGRAYPVVTEESRRIYLRSH